MIGETAWMMILEDIAAKADCIERGLQGLNWNVRGA